MHKVYKKGALLRCPVRGRPDFNDIRASPSEDYSGAETASSGIRKDVCGANLLPGDGAGAGAAFQRVSRTRCVRAPLQSPQG